MSEHPRELIRDLLDGTISDEDLQAIQRAPKDPGRRETVIELEQERVDWDDPIVVCLQEALYVVRKAPGEYVTKCRCGHEFGDAARNWKDSAAVIEREGETEYFVGPRAADPRLDGPARVLLPGLRDPARRGGRAAGLPVHPQLRAGLAGRLARCARSSSSPGSSGRSRRRSRGSPHR